MKYEDLYDSVSYGNAEDKCKEFIREVNVAIASEMNNSDLDELSLGVRCVGAGENYLKALSAKIDDNNRRLAYLCSEIVELEHDVFLLKEMIRERDK